MTKKMEEISVENTEEQAINCLKNEKVVVRFLKKKNGIWGDNPKHVLAGGMAEGAYTVYTTPRQRSGTFIDVLTKGEKKYLEEIMGMEYNALSIYKTTNNYWEKFTTCVRLGKDDTYLDLSDPTDYIKYKILLANKDYVASSLQELQDNPKSTYRYVIIAPDEENKQAMEGMTITMNCYKEYGAIENDNDKLRFIVESLEGKPLSANTNLSFLQVRINNLIQKDPKTFLSVITDKLRDTKVLIKKATENGIISNRDNHYYLREDGTPLCGPNEEATLSVAAKFLNNPRNQDILFAIQAKLQQ